MSEAWYFTANLGGSWRLECLSLPIQNSSICSLSQSTFGLSSVQAVSLEYISLPLYTILLPVFLSQSTFGLSSAQAVSLEYLSLPLYTILLPVLYPSLPLDYHLHKQLV